MKIKPVVTEILETQHTSFQLCFVLNSNITFITGDSGTGKSAAFSFIQEMAAENSVIKCYNYLDNCKRYKTAIKKSKGKLFVIDNADILLDDEMRKYIALDPNNQYIIVGRNPTGLLLEQSEIMELVSSTDNGKTILSLKKYF